MSKNGSIKKAKADLIATVHESLQITDDGKCKRAASEADLKNLETKVRHTLAPAEVPETKKLDKVVDAENDLVRKRHIS